MVFHIVFDDVNVVASCLNHSKPSWATLLTFWNPETVKGAVRLIGPLLAWDSATRHRSRLMNGRFYALAKLDGEFPAEVEIESDGRSIIQDLFYETEGFRCVKCKKMGHLPFQCPGVLQSEDIQEPGMDIKDTEKSGKESSGAETSNEGPAALDPSGIRKSQVQAGTSSLASPQVSLDGGLRSQGVLEPGKEFRREEEGCISRGSVLSLGKEAMVQIEPSEAQGLRVASPQDNLVALTLEGTAENINWDLEDYMSEPEDGKVREVTQEARQSDSGVDGGIGPKGAAEKGGGGSCKWVSREVRRAPDYGTDKKVGRPPKKVSREKETQAQIDLGLQRTLKEGGMAEGPNLRSRRG